MKRSPSLNKNASVISANAKPLVDAPKAAARRIFIGRLSRNVNEKHVAEIFATYGPIKSIDMPLDTLHTTLHKGFAYVEYENVLAKNKYT